MLSAAARSSPITPALALAAGGNGRSDRSGNGGVLLEGRQSNTVDLKCRATYVLPAPLGYYLDGVFLCTEQKCCPEDKPNCREREGAVRRLRCGLLQ